MEFDDDTIKKLEQEMDDEQNARAELAWHIEAKPTDSMIELAAGRRLPPGHVAYLGDRALPPFRPNM